MPAKVLYNSMMNDESICFTINSFKDVSEIIQDCVGGVGIKTILDTEHVEVGQTEHLVAKLTHGVLHQNCSHLPAVQ